MSFYLPDFNQKSLDFEGCEDGVDEQEATDSSQSGQNELCIAEVRKCVLEGCIHLHE